MSYLQTNQLRRNPAVKKNGCCDDCVDSGETCVKKGALGSIDEFFKSGEVWKTIIASAIGALAGALAVRTFDRAARRVVRS